MTSLLKGTRLGRYEIQRELGKGGMGRVYEATQVDLKRRVAIKTLLSANNDSEEMRARFLREGEVSARVEHPHVVQVLDVGTAGDLLYLVMEFLEGEDLKALLSREGALNLERSLEILFPVIAGVAAIHREGVVHRDIKPANIFLHRSRDGLVMPKVLDFGIARILDTKDTELTKTKFAMGTVGYISPEQLQSARRVEPAADQYALGAVLYHSLTARKPFVGEMTYELMHAVIHGNFVPPRQVIPSLPEALESTILRAMGANPTDRFPSVLDFGRALMVFATPALRSRWSSVFGDADFDSVETFIHHPSLPSINPTSPEPQASLVESKGTVTNAATMLPMQTAGATKNRSIMRVSVALSLLGLVAFAILGTLTLTSHATRPATTASTVTIRPLADVPEVSPPSPSVQVSVLSMAPLPAPPVPSNDLAARAQGTPLQALREHSALGRVSSRRVRLPRGPLQPRSVPPSTQETSIPRAPPTAGTNLMPILH